MSKSVIHNYVDKVIYINLDIRQDRREDLEKLLQEYGIEAERYPAIFKDFGIVGCGYSHLNVLKLAKERGYKNILILEDDFIFTVSKEEFEQRMIDLFEQKNEYDVYFLSYNHDNIEKMEEMSENQIINRLLEGTNASGYIVANHYYQKLIDLYEYALPLLAQTGSHWIYANDQIWKQLQRVDRWYYLKTPIGKQKSDFSNNSNEYTNY